MLSTSRDVNPQTDNAFKALKTWARKSTAFLTLLLTPTLMQGLSDGEFFGAGVLLSMKESPSRADRTSREGTRLELEPATLSTVQTRVDSDSVSTPVLALDPLHLPNEPVLGRSVVTLRWESLLILHISVAVYWSTIVGVPGPLWNQFLGLWVDYLERTSGTNAELRIYFQ